VVKVPTEVPEGRFSATVAEDSVMSVGTASMALFRYGDGLACKPAIEKNPEMNVNKRVAVVKEGFRLTEVPIVMVGKFSKDSKA
jgi:hypothetical protein